MGNRFVCLKWEYWPSPAALLRSHNNPCARRRDLHAAWLNKALLLSSSSMHLVCHGVSYCAVQYRRRREDEQYIFYLLIFSVLLNLTWQGEIIQIFRWIKINEIVICKDENIRSFMIVCNNFKWRNETFHKFLFLKRKFLHAHSRSQDTFAFSNLNSILLQAPWRIPPVVMKISLISQARISTLWSSLLFLFLFFFYLQRDQIPYSKCP